MFPSDWENKDCFDLNEVKEDYKLKKNARFCKSDAEALGFIISRINHCSLYIWVF